MSRNCWSPIAMANLNAFRAWCMNLFAATFWWLVSWVYMRDTEHVKGHASVLSVLVYASVTKMIQMSQSSSSIHNSGQKLFFFGRKPSQDDPKSSQPHLHMSINSAKYRKGRSTRGRAQYVAAACTSINNQIRKGWWEHGSIWLYFRVWHKQFWCSKPITFETLTDLTCKV